MRHPAGGATRLERIKDVASLIRDIGVIVGVPTLITVGIGLYDIQSKSIEQQIKANEAQIMALESENDFLKQTQFDRTLALLKSQKEVYEIERAKIEADKSDIEKQLNIIRVSSHKDVEELNYTVNALEIQLTKKGIQLAEKEKDIQLSDSAISKIYMSDPFLSSYLSSIDLTDYQAATTQIEELLHKPTLTAAESKMLQALMERRVELSEEWSKQSSVDSDKLKAVIKDIKSLP